MMSKLCLGLKRCLYVSSQANECQGDSSWHQGLALKLKGSTEAQHLHPEAEMQGAYIPPPPSPQASCLWQAHGDVNPWLQDLQFLHQVENVIGWQMHGSADQVFFFVSLCREWRRSRTCATRWTRFGRKCPTTTNMKSASAGLLRKRYVFLFLHNSEAEDTFFLNIISLLWRKCLNALLLYFQIKRPYFHVKSLEKNQLNNWKEYLDFEIENGTPERVVVLFERCLIACALYEEFWTKVIQPLTSPSLPLLPHQRWYHIDTVNRPALLFACNVDMWLYLLY